MAKRNPARNSPTIDIEHATWEEREALQEAVWTAREKLGELRYMEIVSKHFLECEDAIRESVGNDPASPQVIMIEKCKELRALGLL